MLKRTKLSPSYIYRQSKIKGSGFPQSHEILGGITVWLKHEVDEWMQQCIEQSKEIANKKGDV